MRILCLALFVCSAAFLHAQDSPTGGDLKDVQSKRLKLADQLQEQGDETGALEVLEGLLKKDGENPELIRRVVGLQLRNDRVEAAIPLLKKLLEIEKGKEPEYAAVARLMIESEQVDAANSFLEETAKKFPESAEFPYLLTFSLARAERWPDAIGQFEKTITLAKDDAELLNESFYFRFAAARERAGQFDEAEALFRKTLDLIEQSDSEAGNPEFKATVLNYVAYMWIERGEKLEEAGKYALEAAALDPESGAIADTVGWFHFQKGDYPRALVELKKAERLIKEPDPVILDHLGQTLAKLNEKEFAADYFAKALELDPENAEIKKRFEAVKK
jgi:Flp pilus assembly protein TadD